MVRRRKSCSTRMIKERIQSGLVEFTQHAFEEEMPDEHISKADVLQSVRTGELVARQTHGMRGCGIPKA